MDPYSAPNDTSISTSIEAPPPFEQGEQEEPTYAQPELRMGFDVEASVNAEGIPNNPFFDPSHFEQAYETGELNVDDEDDIEALPRHELTPP